MSAESVRLRSVVAALAEEYRMRNASIDRLGSALQAMIMEAYADGVSAGMRRQEREDAEAATEDEKELREW